MSRASATARDSGIATLTAAGMITALLALSNGVFRIQIGLCART